MSATPVFKFEDNISLYVPHVFENLDQEYIENAFKHIGEIRNIDLVGKRDQKGKFYNAVYVHFVKWNDNAKNRKFFENVINPKKPAVLKHDTTWYWIVLPNNAKKQLVGQRKKTINLETSYEVPTPTLNLEVNVEEKKEETEEDKEMDQIEQFMDEEDMDLITIDAKYVKCLEEENNNMSNYIHESELLKFDLYTEIDKLRCEIIQMKIKYQVNSDDIESN